MSRPPGPGGGSHSDAIYSEHLVAARQDLVQCLGPERRGLGEIRTHLLHILLPALLDFVLEELPQRAVAQALLPLLRMVHDQVGDEGARQASGFLLRVLHHERIDRTEWPGHALPRCPRTAGRGRRRRRWGRGSSRRRRGGGGSRSEEHTSELQSQSNLVCRLLLEKKKERHRRDPGPDQEVEVAGGR